MISSMPSWDRGITLELFGENTALPPITPGGAELLWVSSGRLSCQIRGNTVEAAAGELLLPGPGVPAELRCESGTVILRIHMARSFLDAIYSDPDPEEDTPLRRFLGACLRGHIPFTLLIDHVSDVTPIQNLLENLLWTLRTEAPDPFCVRQRTLSLLLSLLPSWGERLNAVERDTELVLRTLCYLETRYASASQGELAEILRLDPARLSREIHRITGQSYTELLQEKRMCQALWMLRHTDLRVRDISSAVGYTNPSYLYRLFSEQYGMSPRDARMRYRAKPD